jgi:hypothetical protein
MLCCCHVLCACCVRVCLCYVLLLTHTCAETDKGIERLAYDPALTTGDDGCAPIPACVWFVCSQYVVRTGEKTTVSLKRHAHAGNARLCVHVDARAHTLCTHACMRTGTRTATTTLAQWPATTWSRRRRWLAGWAVVVRV